MKWWMRLLLDPTSVDGGGSAPAAAPASPASQVPAADLAGDLPSFNPSSTDPSAGSSTAAPVAGGLSGAQPAGAGRPVATPADPNNRAGASAQTAQTQDWQSIREAAARFGYGQISQYQDDEAALVHLIQQAQRAQQSDTYAQLGRQIAPHLSDFQAYRAQQATAAQQAQAAQAAAAYMPPEFDERWLGLLERDPATGLFYGKPGTPVGIVDAANKRLEWQDRFSKNPIQFFEQYAQDKVAPLIQKQVQQQLAAYQQSQEVDSILASNFQWLYQHDQTGRPIAGANGQYVPTPAGQLYIQQVSALSQAGVRDPRMQDQLARQLVAGVLAQGQAQQRQAAAPQVQGRQALARPNVNPQQARSPQERAQLNVQEPSNEGLSLADMIRRDLDSGGVTDADFSLFD